MHKRNAVSKWKIVLYFTGNLLSAALVFHKIHMNTFSLISIIDSTLFQNHLWEEKKNSNENPTQFMLIWIHEKIQNIFVAVSNNNSNIHTNSLLNLVVLN